MYTPARSDLIALALAAIAARLLVGVVDSIEPVLLAILVFGAVPLVPLPAAWLSGPGHSRSTRFLFRGIAAAAGMAATVMAAATFDGSETSGLLAALMVTLPLSLLAVLVVLITDAILRLRGAAASK